MGKCIMILFMVLGFVGPIPSHAESPVQTAGHILDRIAAVPADGSYDVVLNEAQEFVETDWIDPQIKLPLYQALIRYGLEDDKRVQAGLRGLEYPQIRGRILISFALLGARKPSSKGIPNNPKSLALLVSAALTALEQENPSVFGLLGLLYNMNRKDPKWKDTELLKVRERIQTKLLDLDKRSKRFLNQLPHRRIRIFLCLGELGIRTTGVLQALQNGFKSRDKKIKKSAALTLQRALRNPNTRFDLVPEQLAIDVFHFLKDEKEHLSNKDCSVLSEE